MALQKVVRNMLSTGVSDSSDATAITIDSSENVGIGETSPLGKLHAKVSDTGASASAQGNLLVLEDTENGLSILSSTSAAGYINFGDSDDNDIGMIIYDHSANAMRFWTNAAERMRIDTNGQVMIGHSSSFAHSDADNLAIGDGTNNSGLTIYTGASKESSIIFGNAGTNGNIEAGIKYYHESHGTVANRRAMTFATGGSMSEKMRIDSSGNVGIGTTSPTSKLTIDGSSGAQVTINNAASGDISSGFQIYNGSNLDTHIYTNPTFGNTTFLSREVLAIRAGGAERMRIDTSGKVLISTTSEVDSNCTALHTKATASTKWVQAMSGVDRGMVKYTTASSGTVLYDYYIYNGSVVGSISSAGSSTAYNTTSDARLKDVTGSARGLEVINKLNPVSYNWKADGKADEGLIAQEVMNIVPNAVSRSEEDYYQMDYSKLVTPLIKAVQEQQEQIDALQSEIQQLKGE